MEPERPTAVFKALRQVVPILIEMNPVQVLTLYLLKIHSTLKPSKRVFPSGFPIKIPYVLHAHSIPSSLIWSF